MSPSKTNALTPAPGPPLPWLTVERALWGGLLLAAAASRLVGLADTPLSPSEAERALAGWQLIRGDAPEWWTAPALGVALWGFLFTLGDADVVARLLVAIAGIALVGSPWLFRRHLGVVPCLLAGGLLAVSPTLWAGARTVHEATPALLVGIVLAHMLLTGPIERAPHKILAAGCLALLFNLGAAGVTGVLALGLFYAVRYATWPSGERPPLPVTRPWAPVLVTLALGHILLATSLLQHTLAFGLPSVAAWVAAATPVADETGGIPALLALGGLEPLAVLAGIPCAVWAMARWIRQPSEPAAAIGGLVGVWAAVALIPVLTGGQPSVTALAPAVFPLTLLSGVLLSSVAQTLVLPNRRLLQLAGGALLFFLTFAYMGLARAANPPGGEAPAVAWLSLGLAVLALGALAIRTSTPKALLATAALGFGGLFSVHATGALTTFDLLPYETRLERAGLDEVYDRAALPALRESGRDRTVWVSEELRFAYAWALRDVPGVTYARTPQPDADVIVVQPGVDMPQATGYVRAVLPLTQRWRQTSASPLETWNWAIWGKLTKDARDYQRAAMLVKGTG